jgi:predicted transposase YbfD/YdcC
MIIPLPSGVDLDRVVVTAGARHCQRAAADYRHGRGAGFILPAKDNQPRLSGALDALPWRDVPVARAAAGRGHGRIETRTIQLMDAPGDLPFPHVSQVYMIERHVTGLDGKPLSDVAALGVTSLTATRAGPETIASLVRGQWAIESLHWLRDTLYREDNSTVRTRSGPRAMATLRNLAVGALHQAGRHDTTEATRWAGRYMERPFTILGLAS